MDNLEINLREKVAKIVVIHKKLKEENNILKEQKVRLENTLHEKELILDSLISNAEDKTIAQKLELTENEKGDALKKINNMVKEINKCIALLNT